MNLGSNKNTVQNGQQFGQGEFLQLSCSGICCYFIQKNTHGLKSLSFTEDGSGKTPYKNVSYIF